MNGTYPLIPAVLCAFLMVSCASMSHYEGIDRAVSAGAYEEALASIKASKENAYPPKDKILYYLDEGMIAHYAGDHDGSSKALGEAERAIELAVTKSVSLEASTYLVNDTMQEYPGEDYEDIYLNVFNALNYWKKGSTEGALVEVRRIDNKIKFLSTRYGTAITNSQKSVMEKSSEIPYDPEAATVKFSNSALGQYLGMLFYRSEDKLDDARINRDQVKLAFANQPHMYAFPLPSSLQDELNIPAGKARLNVLCFTGPGPVKVQETIRLRVTNSNWMKIALPVFQTRPSLVDHVEVAIDGGPSIRLEVLEDMSAVAAETFKQRAALIYFKTVMRSLAKTTSSIALDKASEEAESSDAALMMSVLSIGTQIYAEASEQADLRMSRYFPAKALVGGVTLDPGIYSYTIMYYGVSGSVIHQERFENVSIRAGALNLSEGLCIR